MTEGNSRKWIRPTAGSIRAACNTLGLACISVAGGLWIGLWLGILLAGVSLLVLSWLSELNDRR